MAVLSRDPESSSVLQANVRVVGVSGSVLLQEASFKVCEHAVHVHQNSQSLACAWRHFRS
ncbi:hypothetical protein AAFF_G00367810 [Aldrovandia affinis]|uniref:Uncharacterized protein n=1 Tax=Aldrovandia affinis TaxID=143900 RepID=A0AAD7VZA0_9TELE|nr:hypothetical protein AAFF_G00367810 [Aldrovandia affinis]